MKNVETNPAAANPCGLDVGTSRICLATRSGDGYDFRTQLNAFVTVPHSRITEGVLRKEAIPFTASDGGIHVHGNEAERLAALMDVETRRPMSRGVLNGDEPESLSMLREILTMLAGRGENGRRLYYTVPAAPLGAEDGVTYHDATLRQILSNLGYTVHSINEGLAVIYAELEATNYTGIGISCGGGLCNVCLAYLSVPVLSFSIPKAGDYIDSSAASAAGERANRIRMVKEQSFHLNGYCEDKVQQVIGVYYDEMIRSLVSGMKDALRNMPRMPQLNRPLPVVLSGGTALPAGFRERFERIFREETFPFAISEIRLAADPLHTSARGALVAALAEA